MFYLYEFLHNLGHNRRTRPGPGAGLCLLLWR